MRLSVGYSVLGEDVVAAALEHRQAVEEVYFAWPGDPSGRSPAGMLAGVHDPAYARQLEEDLGRLARAGIKLSLLLNANCYGGLAISSWLARRVCALVDHIAENWGLEAVTTTSPFIASVVKEHFPAVEVRASVNMRLGTVHALQQVADLFDGFYIQRDYNRDLERLGELRQWCDLEGKRMYVLANSGCLRFCALQTFHDNMVAHEAEIAAAANVPGEYLACRRFLADPRNWPAVLQATWIRPEDLGRYEELFDGAKLATRMHSRPAQVIAAYATGRFRGNLLDLLEPGHGEAFSGYAIDASRLPEDFFERVTSCGGRCWQCRWCAEVLVQALDPRPPAELAAAMLKG